MAGIIQVVFGFSIGGNALYEVVGRQYSEFSGFAEVGDAGIAAALAQIHEAAVEVGFSEVGLAWSRLRWRRICRL